ncbi:MAG TPA: WYL domain-containing protein [Acidimicrobiia bacterium]|jgi:proteasome accessory factor B|nr:WYL domain-containing protein [Acidimicrobiia bacterium]
MQNVVERILNLLIYLLESPVPVTSNDIRNTVHGYADQSDEAFHRMFERDKQVLRRLGVPLKLEALDAWEIDEGYTVDPEEYGIPDPGLDQEERVALSVAARMVRLGGTEAGLGALIKLGGVERGAGLEPLGADLGEGVDVLGDLFAAVTERRKVKFTYRGHERPIEPYGIAHRRGHWYLVGKSPEGERMYRVDRISDLELGAEEGAFKKPRGFDMRKAVAAQPWEAGLDPETPTTVRFDPDVAWWAARSLGVPEPAGELTTTVNVTNRDAFIGWLLSFGASAEVVAPDEMRAAVVARVGEALAQLS